MTSLTRWRWRRRARWPPHVDREQTSEDAALAAAWAVVAARAPGRLTALLVGASGPLGALVTLSAIDRGEHASARYSAAPVAALACVAGAAAVLRIVDVLSARRMARARRGA